jgi:hypothetical protein
MVEQWVDLMVTFYIDSSRSTLLLSTDGLTPSTGRWRVLITYHCVDHRCKCTNLLHRWHDVRVISRDLLVFVTISRRCQRVKITSHTGTFSRWQLTTTSTHGSWVQPRKVWLIIASKKASMKQRLGPLTSCVPPSLSPGRKSNSAPLYLASTHFYSPHLRQLIYISLQSAEEPTKKDEIDTSIQSSPSKILKQQQIQISMNPIPVNAVVNARRLLSSTSAEIPTGPNWL